MNVTQEKFKRKGLTSRGTKRKYSVFISTIKIRDIAIEDMRNEFGSSRKGKNNIDKNCIDLVKKSPKSIKYFIPKIITIQIK